MKINISLKKKKLSESTQGVQDAQEHLSRAVCMSSSPREDPGKAALRGRDGAENTLPGTHTAGVLPLPSCGSHPLNLIFTVQMREPGNTYLRCTCQPRGHSGKSISWEA